MRVCELERATERDRESQGHLLCERRRVRVRESGREGEREGECHPPRHREARLDCHRARVHEGPQIDADAVKVLVVPGDDPAVRVTRGMNERRVREEREKNERERVCVCVCVKKRESV